MGEPVLILFLTPENLVYHGQDYQGSGHTRKERPTVEDPKFIRLYKCCYYKLININTPTSNINYHKINFS